MANRFYSKPIKIILSDIGEIVLCSLDIFFSMLFNMIYNYISTSPFVVLLTCKIMRSTFLILMAVTGINTLFNDIFSF